MGVIFCEKEVQMKINKANVYQMRYPHLQILSTKSDTSELQELQSLVDWKQPFGFSNLWKGRVKLSRVVVKTSV